MMIRFLFFLTVCIAIYLLWRHIQKLINQKINHQTKTESMVKCHYCQSYSPQKTAAKGPDGQWYCCLAHKQRARK